MSPDLRDCGLCNFILVSTIWGKKSGAKYQLLPFATKVNHLIIFSLSLIHLFIRSTNIY